MEFRPDIGGCASDAGNQREIGKARRDARPGRDRGPSLAFIGLPGEEKKVEEIGRWFEFIPLRQPVLNLLAFRRMPGVAVPKGFRALNAAQRRGLRPVLEGREAQPGTRYVLTLAGRSLQNQPLEERRKQLQAKVMPRTPESVVFSETLEAAPSEVTEAVRAQGLEGVVAKRRNSLYEPRRRIRDRTRKASVSSSLSQVPVQGSA